MKPDTIHKLQESQFEYRNGRKICTFEDLSMSLPTEASMAGLTLTAEEPPYSSDPIYLKDSKGNILREWEKSPSLTEIRETALSFLK